MARLNPTAAFGKKKTTTTTTSSTMPDLGGPVKAPPALVNQATPPPSAAPRTGGVDPVTGAVTAPGGAPPPPPPGSGGGGAGGAGGGVTAPPEEGLAASGAGTSPQQAPAPVSTPTGGPIGPAPKVTPGTPTGMPDEVIIKEGVFDPREGDISDEALFKALRELNLSRIKGASDVDTTEAESLIRDLMQRQLGAQQVGQRASMGRAGFASSGALAGMESDAQQQAAQNAQREILGLRRSEDQRAFDNAQDAAGTDLDYLKYGSDDEIRRAQLKALQDYLGLPGADEPGGGGFDLDGGMGPRVAEGILTGANRGLLNDGVETETPSLANAGGSTTGRITDPIPADEPPEGGVSRGFSESKGGEIFYVPDNPNNPSAGGKFYVVKA